ncbi:MAG: hypothetical protein KA155_01135 [Alphaproteobacteria bacterium]|jgi:hypothetical protein|nr:hypothetical protein [Alphaproteobacteria bacterium]
MPVETTAIERKPKDYENVATPFDWPENKTLTDIYLDNATTSEDLAAFISSDHIYTDKYGTRYFGDIAVPSLLTQFSGATNDTVAQEKSGDFDNLVLPAGYTSQHDRIMNLITDGQPGKAIDLIDNLVQNINSGNQENILNAIMDFWFAMNEKGFNAQANYLHETLTSFDLPPEAEKDSANNKKLLTPKPDKSEEFQPIVIGGIIARTKEEEEQLRRAFALLDMSHNGPG